MPNTKIFVKAGKTAKVKFQYLPITYEVHVCHLVLIDVMVGELQYDIVSTPMPPLKLETFQITTSLENNKPQFVMMSFPYKNKLDAYQKVEELCRKESDIEFRDFIQRFMREEKEVESFKIEKANGEKDVTIPDSFKIVNFAKIGDQEGNQTKIDTKEANQFKVQLNFRNPVKDYNLKFIIKNSELSDVRVYELLITVLPKVFKATLEFQTPAMLEIK